MRILIAVHGFPPSHSAGAERQAERMANWLVRAGHHVEVFAVEDVNASEYQLETTHQSDLIVHRVHFNIHSGETPFLNSYANPLLQRAMTEVLDSYSFDLVHVISGYLLGIFGIMPAIQRGIPVVVSPMEFYYLCVQLTLVHTNGQLCSGPESDNKCAHCRLGEKRSFRMLHHARSTMDLVWGILDQTPIVRNVEHDIALRRESLTKALNQANLVICNSQFLIDKFAEFGFDTSRYLKIRQGLASVSVTERASRLRVSDGTLRLVYTGQIKPHKGVDVLVDAVISRLQSGANISLDLWGNETNAAEYVATLKNRSASYPAINFHGQFTGSQVWNILTRFDALVVPSRWYENSPNVILEAFAMGLPVIASRLGGIPELVTHDVNGLLFDTGSVAELTSILSRLEGEAGLLERLQEGIPQSKSIDEEMVEVMQAYQQLLDQHKLA